jgi:uncharacterized Zn finger protein
VAVSSGRTPWDGSWPHGARIPGNGLASRSRRGAFATTWWGRRFVDAMEAVAGPGRVARGRTYARAGQVLSLAVTPGRVTAAVQGSRTSPYAVELSFDTWDAAAQAGLADAVAASPVVLAAVLGGQMPQGFEELCDEAGLALFPASLADARFDCTCPDLGDPCKHAAAVVYLLSEWLDDEPFGVLTLRGVQREELLARAAALQRSAGEDRSPSSLPERPLADGGSSSPVPVGRFYAAAAPLPAPEPGPVPADGRTVLDDLDASLLGPGGGRVADRLRDHYAALAGVPADPAQGQDPSR